jgi:DNA-directed RNA polymerase specialized sigma24 family protein
VSNQHAEFADFFQASWEPCLRALVAVVGSPALAEDQAAEAFAKAWASWPKLRRHPAPQAWVVRTALNTGASWWRRRSRELPLADHDLTASFAVLPPSSFGGHRMQGVAMGLIDASSYTCTSTTMAEVSEVAPWAIFWPAGQS